MLTLVFSLGYVVLTIKRKITLVGDVSSKPSIIIGSHDLYTSDIRRVVSDIGSYDKREYLCVVWSFFGLPFFFVSFCDGFGR